MCKSTWLAPERGEDERLHAGKMLQQVAGWASPAAEECIGGAVGLAMSALLAPPEVWEDKEKMAVMSVAPHCPRALRRLPSS